VGSVYGRPALRADVKGGMGLAGRYEPVVDEVLRPIADFAPEVVDRCADGAAAAEK
jgi:hypothetical protein